MQGRYHDSTCAKSTAAWAVCSLFLVVLAPTWVYSVNLWPPWLRETYPLDNKSENWAGQWLSCNIDAGDDAMRSLFLSHLAISTAVASPTARVISPMPRNTVPPPVEPTNTVSLLAFTATPDRATMPILTTESATAAPVVTPTLQQMQPEASFPASPGESVSATGSLVPETQPAISTQAVTTGTAILTSPTTYTAQIAVPSGSLLDRLTRNKPGIWGNKAFYIGLVVIYIVLLALFFRLVFRLAQDMDQAE